MLSHFRLWYNARRGSFVFLALIAWVWIYLLVAPFRLSGDGLVRYQSMMTFLETNTPSPMPYSFIGPFFSLPLLVLDHVSGAMPLFAMRFNALLLIVGLLCVYILLIRVLDPKIIRTFLLLVTMASMMPMHGLHYYGEVFTVIMMTVGTVWFVVSGSWWAWVLMAVGVSNTPAALVGFVFVALYAWYETGRARMLVPVVLAAGLIGAEAWIKTFSGLSNIAWYAQNHGFQTMLPYSGRAGFSFPFLLGIASLFFSFGKGIVFFAPGLLLVPQAAGESTKTIRRLFGYWIVFLFGLIGVYAMWWSWYGGWFWGPRFLLFASVPASLALAICLSKRKPALRATIIGLLILTLSFWIGISGLVFGEDYLAPYCTSFSYAYEHLCWYVPEFSVLWAPFVFRPEISSVGYIFLWFGIGMWGVVSAPLWLVLYKYLLEWFRIARSIIGSRTWTW
jgi:hypothetical protein